MTCYNVPMEKRGIIALDIDGTITDEHHLIPDAVAQYLHDLSHQWVIFLITGRSLIFAESSITKLNFPFTLAVQNGADIFRMPAKDLLMRHYIARPTLQKIETRLQTEPDDFIIYSGFEKGDICYWRPEKVSPKLKRHFEKLQRYSSADWIEVGSYEEIEQKAFPLIKYFGPPAELEKIAADLQVTKGINAPVIRDPMDPSLSMVLITDEEANKGQALEKMKLYDGLDLPIIAAGDDQNDLPMLEKATVRIVIETAPHAMHHYADILAKPSKDFGILEALPEAIKRL